MAILEIVFPIFAIAFIGYLVTYAGLFNARDIRGISRFVFDIAIPIMLFNSMARIDLPDTLNWGFLLSYYLVAVFMFFLGMAISSRWFQHSIQEQSVFGLGSSYSNTVLVGLPIITTGLGEQALLPMFMLISIHSALLFFLVTLMAERNGGAGPDRTIPVIAGQSLKKMVSNPIIIGLATGLLFNLLAISIPTPIAKTIELISGAALPSALFVLGASLSAYKLAGHFRAAWTLTGLKLLLMPALVALLAFVVFDLQPLWAAVAVMNAGMPLGINVYMFAQKYEAGIETISTAILLSTSLSVVTISLMLFIFV